MTGDSDSERLRARALRGETGPGCFVPGLDGSNVDECKKSSEQWKRDLERKPLSLSCI